MSQRTHVGEPVMSGEGSPRSASAGSAAVDRGQRSAPHAAAADPAGAAAPQGGPLGSTQSNCTTDPHTVDRRRVRFAARAALWEASTLKPVRCCGRTLSPVRPVVLSDGSTRHVVEEDGERDGVGVKRRQGPEGAVAAYSGLTYCGNVWSCPRCSAVVAMERSLQIARAVAECQRAGGQVHFLTLTLRHHRGDRLEDLFGFLHAGWRRVAGSSSWSGASWETETGERRSSLGDRDRFGVGGSVRIIESTVSRPGFGGHGWHLHMHVLLFTMGSLAVGLRPDYQVVLTRMLGRSAAVDESWLARTVFHCRLAQRWSRGVTKAGGRVPGAAGVDLRTVTDGGLEYIGGYMAKSTYDVATRLGAEVAAGDVTKTAHEAANVSPFGLLAELIADGPRFGFRTPRRWEIVKDGDDLDLIDITSGEATRIEPPGAWRLWSEWEQATSGRRQIAWAHRTKGLTERERFWNGLLESRGEDAETDDSDLAAREIDGVVLGEIARSSWYSRLVWRPSLLVDALEAAERGGEALREWMRDHHIEYDPR